jgi:hypothetical protein
MSARGSGRNRPKSGTEWSDRGEATFLKQNGALEAGSLDY